MNDSELTNHSPARVSSRRPATSISLPDDSKLAGSLVLAFINARGDSYERSEAIEAATLRVGAMLQRDGVQFEEDLAMAASVCLALHYRFSALSVESSTVQSRSIYLRMSLKALDSHTRSVVAITGLRLQRQATAKVLTPIDG